MSDQQKLGLIRQEVDLNRKAMDENIVAVMDDVSAIKRQNRKLLARFKNIEMTMSTKDDFKSLEKTINDDFQKLERLIRSGS